MQDFKALRIHRQDGRIVPRFERMSVDDLTPGEVLIRVRYSSINYKDALAATGTAPILRKYPLNGGIDLSGEVESSSDARYAPGQPVLVTGCDLSESVDGGYAEYARVAGDSVIPMPDGLDPFRAMVLGTAGFTADLDPGDRFGASVSNIGDLDGDGVIDLLVAATGDDGDLGTGDDPVLHPPVPPEAADFVLLESTCGRREHRLAETLTRLAKLLSRTAARGGVVLMLTHAAGQAQMLLCVLQRLKRTARIADLPLHLDSAIAEAATVLYAQHTGEHRLSADECVSLLAGVSVARTEDEALALSHLGQPGIIIAADGETEGPRMAQHLKAYAGDERHTIVFAGQPPAGSRGAALLAGAQRVKIQGEWLRLRAEVVALDGLSGHADRKALLDWVLALPRAPQHVYLMHGEPEAADSLRQALGERCDWPCSVPEIMDLVNV